LAKKFYETQEFLAVQRVWYRKLKDEYFEDAEKLLSVSPEPVLAQFSTAAFRTLSQAQDLLAIKNKRIFRGFKASTRYAEELHSRIEEKAEFYRRIEHALNQDPPKEAIEKRVMELYANGQLISEISEALGLSRRQSKRIIEEHLSKWKIRIL
jgi:RNA polymerase-interacting CarD/CdnL/TRCF family regulator